MTGIASPTVPSFDPQKIDANTLKTITELIYKQNADLVKLDRLKDEFVSLASHELRTPLTIIKNYLWRVLNRPDSPLGPKTRRDLEVTYASVDRLMTLVEDMLTVSRIEDGRITLQKEMVELNDLVGGLIEEYAVKAQEKQIRLIFASLQKVVRVLADKNRLKSVLINLLGNALKFTPISGTILMSAFHLKGNAYILCWDTGPGIPKDKQGIIFTKFGRVDESYEHANVPTASGTGLGLYLSREIMRLHGGDISLVSDAGKGAIFIVSLPDHSSPYGYSTTLNKKEDSSCRG
jgi:signal transduction histidine kinase